MGCHRFCAPSEAAYHDILLLLSDLKTSCVPAAACAPASAVTARLTLAPYCCAAPLTAFIMGVRDVPADSFITAYANHLKRSGKVRRSGRQD